MHRNIVLFILAASLSEGVATKDMIDPNAKIRHSFNTRPLELNVDAKETYNNKFMNLMESACRPESDGFFGATYGEPVKITYGFQLEAQPLSSIVELLDIMEDKVVDDILSNLFPEMCGFRRRLSHHVASGFRFFKFQEVEKCDPTVSPVNFCGYFTGQVNVYGREEDKATVEVLKLLDSTFNPSDPTKLHPELVGMATADQYKQVTGGNVQLEDTNKQTLAWAGLALAICVFTFTLWWVFLRSEKEGDTGELAKSTVHQSCASGWRSWIPFANRRGGVHQNMPYDPEEMSIGPHFEDEGTAAASFQDDDRLLVTDGRPVYMHYGDASASEDSEDEDQLI